MKLRLLHDQVMVRLDDEQESTEGGLHIPEAHRERPRAGTIVACGPGIFDDESGRFIPTQLEPGQRVIVTWRAGQELTIDGKTHWIVRELCANPDRPQDGILAVIE